MDCVEIAAPASKYVHEPRHANTRSGFRPAHPEPPNSPELPARSCATQIGHITCYQHASWRTVVRSMVRCHTPLIHNWWGKDGHVPGGYRSDDRHLARRYGAQRTG